MFKTTRPSVDQLTASTRVLEDANMAHRTNDIIEILENKINQIEEYKKKINNQKRKTVKQKFSEQVDFVAYDQQMDVRAKKLHKLK